MKNSTRLVYLAAACTIALGACDSSKDSTLPAAAAVTDPNPEISFFNNDAETSFVNSMMGRFVSLVRPLSAVNSDLDNNNDRFVLATERGMDNCEDGGSMSYSYTTDDFTSAPTATKVSYIDCKEYGETSNGSVSFTADLDANGDNGTINLTANNFSVTGSEEEIGLNGSVIVEMETNGAVSSSTISGPGMTMTADSETITFSNYSVTMIMNDDTDAASVYGSVTVASSEDGTITVVMDPPLNTGGEDEYPSTGTLSLTHSDGSSMVLNADNGNPETFDFVINDNGVVSSGSERWDETDLINLDL